jgi:hypothetical protein
MKHIPVYRSLLYLFSLVVSWKFLCYCLAIIFCFNLRLVEQKVFAVVAIIAGPARKRKMTENTILIAAAATMRRPSSRRRRRKRRARTPTRNSRSWRRGLRCLWRIC